jgi:hypothetical protein
MVEAAAAELLPSGCDRQKVRGWKSEFLQKKFRFSPGMFAVVTSLFGGTASGLPFLTEILLSGEELPCITG